MSTETQTINPLEHLSNDSNDTNTNNDAATGATNALLKQLTDSVISTLDSKLTEHASSTETHVIAQVNRILLEKTDGITEKAAKRFREDSADHITQAHNKDQYLHNLSILRTMDKVANNILHGDADAAIKDLSDGKNMINRRQKLVLLADSEPHGWEFVHAYTKESLAADSDEEKAFARIRRTLKATTDSSQKDNARSPGRHNTGSTRRFQSYLPERSSHDRIPRTSQRSNRPTSPRRAPSRDFRRDRYDRLCFRCNRRGHLSFACPDQ